MIKPLDYNLTFLLIVEPECRIIVQRYLLIATAQRMKHNHQLHTLAFDMDTKDSKEKLQTELPTREGLIRIEWEMINELQRMIKDPELTITERTRVATVFAFHANTLNKLLTQKGEKDQFEDQNLGDYIKGVEPRIARRFRRDFSVWKRALTSRR